MSVHHMKRLTARSAQPLYRDLVAKASKVTSISERG